jgi:hypothetical protein
VAGPATLSTTNSQAFTTFHLDSQDPLSETFADLGQVMHSGFLGGPTDLESMASEIDQEFRLEELAHETDVNQT